MAEAGERRGISRRSLLIGGGAGAGLVLAWALWPRSYAPNLRVREGETLFNAFLKIANDGRVIVAVPQVELGQGVTTSLPQILADELGAEWETVAVEMAPISPLYANDLLMREAAEGAVPAAFRDVGQWAAREYATRSALMLTGGSSSIRAFEPRMREAGAAARVLLAKAAARRWNVEWEALDTAGGFVVNGNDRIRFAELAEAAAGEELPDILPMRGGTANRLIGQPKPRIDVPSKIDGTAQFTADVRLPGLVYASTRRGPIGDSRLVEVNRAAAEKLPGVLAILENERWAGVVGTNWWAANRALEAMKPVFETQGGLITSEGVDLALAEALEEGEASRVFARGDVEAAYKGGTVYRAHYSAGVAPNAALEPLTATARFTGDRLEVWASTQAPGLARAAAARAAGSSEGQVTLYPMQAGSGYGRKLETAAIEQVVVIAARMQRPVQLVWSRVEESWHDTFRPPALARLTARLGEGGMIQGWQARIAAASGTHQAIERLSGGRSSRLGRGSAIDGAIPGYAIPAVAIDHVPVETGLQLGPWRSGPHSLTAFFTESFIDELSRQAAIEPLSFRMQMLGDNPRLARVLSTAAALGGWDGGGAGSAMGIAAHAAFGSYAATLVEVSVGRDQRVLVNRAVCAVDCGRIVNPDILRQQIEGGILFGIGGATGNPIGFEGGFPDARGFGALGLPTLATSPEVSVEIIPSEEEPGGATELAVPTVAPAIANALFALTGQRLRSLPLVVGSGG